MSQTPTPSAVTPNVIHDAVIHHKRDVHRHGRGATTHAQIPLRLARSGRDVVSHNNAHRCFASEVGHLKDKSA
jgi:hypothetical protein